MVNVLLFSKTIIYYLFVLKLAPSDMIRVFKSKIFLENEEQTIVLSNFHPQRRYSIRS